MLNARPVAPTVFGALLTPFMRVAMAARHSAESYKPFSIDDAASELTARLVYVVVRPFEKRGAGIDRFVDAKHVVILPTGSHDAQVAIQPTWLKPDATTLQNAFGARVEARGIVAAFPPEAIAAGRDFVFIYAAQIIDGPAFSNITQQRLPIRAEDVAAWR